MKIVFLVVAVFTIFASCSSNDEPAPVINEEPSLVGSWKEVAYKHWGSEEWFFTSCETGIQLTHIYSADGTFTADSYCNNNNDDDVQEINGTYIAEGDIITVYVPGGSSRQKITIENGTTMYSRYFTIIDGEEVYQPMIKLEKQ